MGLEEARGHQESTSINELWTMMPPGRSILPPGGTIKNCKDDFLLNAAEEISNACSSRDEPGCPEFEDDGLEFSKSTHGRHLESYFMSSGSIRIPEAGNFESVLNKERLANFLPDGDEEPDTKHENATSHTCEIFDQFGGVHDHAGCSSTQVALTSRPLSLLHLKFEDIGFKVVPRKGGLKVFDLKIMSSFSLKKWQKKAAYAEKHILNGVNGEVASGEVLAMMGPSGSGKTTMLNILGGRLHDKFTGNIFYNGLPYSSSLKSRIGYVTQDDILFPILTVRETLIFAALLRLPKGMNHIEKVARAETVLRELGLERCQNTIIGGPFIKGLSGGERKRTSIGYEILVDPSLLLLDEPTSGLDSSTAFRILQVLRANAQVGRVIVTTIHQPSSRMFPMFDKLILLSEGHPVYFGAAKDAMDYFASLQFVPQLPMNPADFLLDLASGITNDITTPTELSVVHSSTKSFVKPYTIAKGEHVAEDRQCTHQIGLENKSTYHNLVADELALTMQSETKPYHHKSIEKELTIPMQSSLEFTPEDLQHQLVMKYLRVKYTSKLGPRERETKQLLSSYALVDATIKTRKQWSSSWWKQFTILCRRNFRERRKDYMSLLRFIQNIIVAVLLGILWWQPKLETEREIRDQVGLIFYICTFWCTFSMWSTLMVFPLERNFLAKERAADMYRLSAYYMSSTLCDLVAELIHPTLFIVMVYFMTNLKSDFKTFSLTLLSVYLIAITAQAFGEFFGAAMLSVQRVGIVSSMTMLIFLLAGGYYVQNIPIFLRWIRYISIIYYGFNLLQRVQYSPHQTYNCHEIGGCMQYNDSPIFGDLNLDGGIRDAFALIGMTFIYKSLAYLCLYRV